VWGFWSSYMSFFLRALCNSRPKPTVCQCRRQRLLEVSLWGEPAPFPFLSLHSFILSFSFFVFFCLFLAVAFSFPIHFHHYPFFFPTLKSSYFCLRSQDVAYKILPQSSSAMISSMYICNRFHARLVDSSRNRAFWKRYLNLKPAYGGLVERMCAGARVYFRPLKVLAVIWALLCRQCVCGRGRPWPRRASLQPFPDLIFEVEGSPSISSPLSAFSREFWPFGLHGPTWVSLCQLPPNTISPPSK